METEMLELDAFISDLPETLTAQPASSRRVERRVVFTVSLAGTREAAVLDAVLVGQKGQPLHVSQMLQDDLNLPPDQAKALAQAIYEGHFTPGDHEDSPRQSRLTGELNVEPYWEVILRERLVPAM